MFILLAFGSLSSKKPGLVNTVVAELQESKESSWDQSLDQAYHPLSVFHWPNQDTGAPSVKGDKWNPLLNISSVQFSCSVMSDSLLPHGLQNARLPCPSPTLEAGSNSCPSSRWCHTTISSCHLSPSPAISFSQHQGLFQWVSSSHQVTKVLELQHQHQQQSFQWIFSVDFLKDWQF